MKDDRDILILYLEDYADILDTWLKFIKECWSPESLGCRSREKALELLDEWEEAGVKPDLVIFDRSILDYEDDDLEDREAGNELYLHLAMLEIPVAVFSSDHDVLAHEEPFYSHPPQLGFHHKEAMADDLKAAVSRYKQEFSQ